jgi:hypothetical protein
LPFWSSAVVPLALGDGDCAMPVPETAASNATPIARRLIARIAHLYSSVFLWVSVASAPPDKIATSLQDTRMFSGKFPASPE